MISVLGPFGCWVWRSTTCSSGGCARGVRRSSSLIAIRVQMPSPRGNMLSIERRSSSVDLPLDSEPSTTNDGIWIFSMELGRKSASASSSRKTSPSSSTRRSLAGGTLLLASFLDEVPRPRDATTSPPVTPIERVCCVCASLILALSAVSGVSVSPIASCVFGDSIGRLAALASLM